jgi:peroxiredoxin
MTFAEIAAATLFRMRKLQPGQQAPEIEGPDLDGDLLRLSDYRGKIVLLSFWGHW